MTKQHYTSLMLLSSGKVMYSGRSALTFHQNPLPISSRSD